MFIVKLKSVTSTSPKIAVISGMITLFTSALTIAVNAVLIARATARSITLPRLINSLNS